MSPHPGTLTLTQHRTLYQWWAEYMESLGDLETALQFYRDGGDHTSIVRIHCYMGNIDKVGVATGGMVVLDCCTAGCR